MARMIVGRGGMPLVVDDDGAILWFGTMDGHDGFRFWVCCDTDRVYEHGDGHTTTHDPDDPIWIAGCACPPCRGREWD